MRSRYSRLYKSEQRSSIKSAVIYIVLTIVAIYAILFFGIPAIGKVAGFIHDLQTTNQPIDATDTTPPAPPIIDGLPQVVNRTSIEVTGRTEEGALVILFVNDREEEVVANNEGAFSYDWSLWDGENKLSAIARDTSGNESQITEVYKITYDNEPPDLEITNPSEGQTFSGSRQRQITIDGNTESGVSVTINERIVAVDDGGNFSFFTSLSEGENKFNIIAKDAAGNETQAELTLTFNP